MFAFLVIPMLGLPKPVVEFFEHLLHWFSLLFSLELTL